MPVGHINDTRRTNIMKQVNTFDLLKAMIEIAPKNDVRYYMNGIHITRGDSAEVIVEATDAIACSG